MIILPHDIILFSLFMSVVYQYISMEFFQNSLINNQKFPWKIWLKIYQEKNLQKQVHSKNMINFL